ncbi:response regulator [bacterium]|nr:response regulator [bacterium]NIN92774.1 response regulator [bacterium]NIO18755.1 response regulator [bacterium]NIO73831.1 response regulator [bacterium]
MPEKVLVVEDEPDTLQLLKESLEYEGYQVITAIDGIEAEDKAHRENPDIIILDVFLPKRDGYEVCKRLREDKNSFGIPIIMLTAKDDYGSRLKGFLQGAFDYVTKPFSMEDLIKKTKRLLSTRKK